MEFVFGPGLTFLQSDAGDQKDRKNFIPLLSPAYLEN